MKRSIKNAAFAAVTLASVIANAVPAVACGGGGGGGRSFARASYARSAYTQPAYPRTSYVRPTYSQPSYSQPSYSQPTYSQPVYAQPTYSQPTYSQPTISQPSYTTATPVYSRPTTTTQLNSQIVKQKPATNFTQSPSPRPVVAATPANAQTAPKTQPPVQPAETKNAESNALALLVSIAGESAKSTAATNTNDAATASAIPEFSAPAATEKNGQHVGIWTVVLPGQQSVTLQLDADGKFVWTAKKAGKSSQFDGQYRISDGRLTLVRSADLQQMNGTWTAGENGFVFKLDGATTGGLNFQRS